VCHIYSSCCIGNSGCCRDEDDDLNEAVDLIKNYCKLCPCNNIAYVCFFFF
jgi:hypothetical protein